MSTKEKILQLIHGLPDDLSVDELIDELYLREKIEIGLDQADAGDVMPHEEFKRQILSDS